MNNFISFKCECAEEKHGTAYHLLTDNLTNKHLVSQDITSPCIKRLFSTWMSTTTHAKNCAQYNHKTTCVLPRLWYTGFNNPLRKQLKQPAGGPQATNSKTQSCWNTVDNLQKKNCIVTNWNITLIKLKVVELNHVQTTLIRKSQLYVQV